MPLADGELNIPVIGRSAVAVAAAVQGPVSTTVCPASALQLDRLFRGPQASLAGLCHVRVVTKTVIGSAWPW